MKAIKVSYHGMTATRPGRYIARDLDGNTASSKESYPDAAKALCKKMGWTGELIAGSLGKGVEVYVWAEGSLRVKV